MFNNRQNKVSRLIQKELSEVFKKEDLGFPSNLLLTITTVRMTPDLAIGKVYLSIFPSEKSTEILAYIEQIKKNIRFLLGKRIRNQMKEIPDISFYIDDSLDYIDKIEKLLKK